MRVLRQIRNSIAFCPLFVLKSDRLLAFDLCFDAMPKNASAPATLGDVVISAQPENIKSMRPGLKGKAVGIVEDLAVNQAILDQILKHFTVDTKSVSRVPVSVAQVGQAIRTKARCGKVRRRPGQGRRAC
jgi:hypothetical protein